MCSGLELHQTGSDVSDNAGVYVATLQVQLCPIAVVAIAWHNCTNTQRLGVAEKSRWPVRDFLREKFAKKNAFLSAEIWV